MDGVTTMALTKQKETYIDMRLNDICSELKDIDGVTKEQYNKHIITLHETIDKVKFLAQKVR